MRFCTTPMAIHIFSKMKTITDSTIGRLQSVKYNIFISYNFLKYIIYVSNINGLFRFPRSILQIHLSLAMLAIGGLAVGRKTKDIDKKWPLRPVSSDPRGWKCGEITRVIKTRMSVIWLWMQVRILFKAIRIMGYSGVRYYKNYYYCRCVSFSFSF